MKIMEFGKGAKRARLLPVQRVGKSRFYLAASKDCFNEALLRLRVGGRRHLLLSWTEGSSMRWEGVSCSRGEKRVQGE